MPVNLEIKVKIKSFKEIIKILNEIGAKFDRELNQKDIYFNSSKGLLKLRKENEHQQLIRYERNENSKNRWSNYEYINIDDSKAEKYLKNIFESDVVVEKKRLLYIYDNTRIHLDTVKNLGKFLELEAILITTKSEAKKRFDFLVKKLNLDKQLQLKLSYRDLIIQMHKNK